VRAELGARAVLEEPQEHASAASDRRWRDIRALEAPTVDARQYDLVVAATSPARATVERDRPAWPRVNGVTRCAVADDIERVARYGRRDETAERPASREAVGRLAEIEDGPAPEVGGVTAIESRNDEARALG
jgi:hypothetical protein